MEDTGRRALHGQAAVGIGVLAVMSPSAFLPSPPRKGKRGWTAGHLLSLPYSPLGRRRRNLQGPLLFQKHSPSPSLTACAHPLGGRSLLPLSAAFTPSANLSWRLVLPVRASCPPGRLLPSFSARAVLPPPFAELSACVQLPAFGQPGDASSTQSTKGPMSHTALQKLLLYPSTIVLDLARALHV